MTETTVGRTSLFAPTRDRLLPVAWFAAACMVVLEAAKLISFRWLGADARIFWSVWQRPTLYSIPAGTPRAFLYPPVFAQVIYPLTLMPRAAFTVLWIAAAVAAYAWMLRPLRWVWAVPLAALAIEDVVTGSAVWVLALAVAVSLRWPIAWLVPALTKVGPSVGALWFAGRGEWRTLARVAAVGAAVVAVSVALSPGQWVDWLAFMQANRAASPLVRAALAAGLAWWAGRTGRAWVLPFAALLATPLLGIWPLGLLCAVPRLMSAAALASAREPFGGVRATVRRALDLA